MIKYKFPCGCEFEVVNDQIKECDGLPSLAIDYYNIPLDCPVTWELIQSGKTKGIFQLETNLGKKWSKTLLPRDLEELSALISLVRPGCLRALVDGKSMTQHYCDRKNNIDEVIYFHQALQPILKSTQGVLVYQEESMKIAQDIAGFTLEEADTLRKAIGKKKADVMSQIKQQFIDGCAKVGIVTPEEAAEIFGWIQESQRYSFNASHALSYGMIGYWTAYAKAHFPLHFYAAWLYFAHEKMDPQEEIQQLVSDSKNFNINICPPCIKYLFNGDPGHFSIKDDSVYFGINDIKKIGESHVEHVLTNVKVVESTIGRTIDKWTWSDFLVFFSDLISQTVVNGLIAAGATDYMGKSRSKKIHDYNEWRKLTDKERDFIKTRALTNNAELIDHVIYLLQNKNKLTTSRRAKITDILNTLQNPSYSLEDDAHFIAQHEQELLGIPLTCTKLDTCTKKIQADSTCKEFLDGKSGKMSFCVEIIGVGEYIIKQGKSKGQKMLFLQVDDGTGTIESAVAFPNVLHGNESLLINGSTLMIEGKRDTRNKDSFIIENIVPI